MSSILLYFSLLAISIIKFIIVPLVHCKIWTTNQRSDQIHVEFLLGMSCRHRHLMNNNIFVHDHGYADQVYFASNVLLDGCKNLN